MTRRPREQEKAAFAKLRPKAPAQPPKPGPLARKRAPFTAAKAREQAQIHYDYWVLNEVRRRQPARFEELRSMHPGVRTNLFSLPEWTQQEKEVAASFVDDLDVALIQHANQLPEPQRSRLLTEINLRERVCKQRQHATKLRPAQLLKELEAYQRAERQTPSWDENAWRLNRRLYLATKREAERRGLITRRDAQ
jgi:hypothetical protein